MIYFQNKVLPLLIINNKNLTKMGLDTTHDCWHGSYSTFNRFRYALANEIGINLDDYIGYGGKGYKPLSSIKHDILPLLDHSDCDGILTVAESKRVLNGLKDILSKVPKEFPWSDYIVQFIAGLELAISKNEAIEFH